MISQERYSWMKNMVIRLKRERDQAREQVQRLREENKKLRNQIKTK